MAKKPPTFNEEKLTVPKDTPMQTASSPIEGLEPAESATKSVAKSTIKVVHVSALFPQLRGGRAHQQARGRGSTVQAALGAAMRDLVKQKGLRKQRYSEFSATFTVATVLEETTDATGEASEHQAE